MEPRTLRMVFVESALLALSRRLASRRAARDLGTPLLGGSWVVISGVISPLICVIVIIVVTLIITPLITTHEPPSRCGGHLFSKRYRGTCLFYEECWTWWPFSPPSSPLVKRFHCLRLVLRSSAPPPPQPVLLAVAEHVFPEYQGPFFPRSGWPGLT